MLAPEPLTTTTSIEPVAAPSLIAAEPPAPEFTPYTAETLTDVPPAVIELFNKHKLPGEATKDLIAYQTNLQQEAAKATATAWADQNQTWQTESKSNPDWGGDKLPVTLAAVKTLITEYGDPSFFGMLDATGAGNHPAMINLLYKISQALPKEGAPLVGQPAITQATLAERIFTGPKQ